MNKFVPVCLPGALLAAGLLLSSQAGWLARPAEAQMKGNLTIQLEGLQDQKGKICINLFSSNKGFPDSRQTALRHQCQPIQEIPLTINFTNLVAGSYVVAVFHDRNNDGKLNRNGSGIPTEGVGFSNNPVVRTGPPAYGKCVFLVAGPNTSLKIRMRYSFSG